MAQLPTFVLRPRQVLQVRTGGIALFLAGICFGIVFTTNSQTARNLIFAAIGLFFLGMLLVYLVEEQNETAHQYRVITSLIAVVLSLISVLKIAGLV